MMVCLKKKSDCWCVNMIIFSVVIWGGELFSNDGLSPILARIARLM